MKTPFLYRLARMAVAFAVRVYFRGLEVSGGRNVPATGPVVLAANHPQSITDALVLGLAAGRMVCYLAHSGLFRNRLKRGFLTRCGVIPVFRPADVAGASERNVEVFAACYRLLEDGGVIGIFPEGTSGQERRIGRLKTGAARIALQCEERRDWGAGVVVVPAGINFESRGRFRSRVLVSFGERIRVADFREDYARDPATAVRLLTDAIDAGIRRRVVDIEHAEYERMVRDIERVYRDERLERNDSRVRGRSRFRRSQAVSREIPRAIEYFLVHRPETVWTIRVALREYLRKLERLKLSDEMMRDDPSSVRRAALQFTTRGLIGLPFALWGTVWNVLPYKITGIIAKRAAPDLTQLHFYQLVFGAVLYVAYYVPLFYAAWRMAGAAATAVFAATLVPTGFFARWYGRLMQHRRKTIRLAALELRHGYLLQRVRRERAAVVRLLDEALEEYLSDESSAAPRSRSDKPGVPPQ